MLLLEKLRNLSKDNTDDVLEFCNDLDKEIVIMPAGIHGQTVYEKYLKPNGCRVKYFVDNNPEVQGTFINGIKVISFNEFLEEKDNLKVLIASRIGIYNEIQKQISNYDIDYTYVGEKYYYCEQNSYANPCEQIITKISNYNNLLSILEDNLSKKTLDNILEYRFNYKDINLLTEIKRPLNNQYFEPEIYQISKDDCFVDCGAFTGDTLEVCLKETRGTIERYFAFEPDEKNYNQLLEKKYDFLETFCKGVSDKNATLYFESGGNSGSKITNSGSTQIKVVSLDSELKNQKITFIKMDIEGAEIDALKGAAGIIKKQKPVLAICVYHKFNDIFEIPELIQSFKVDYKYYLRHYTDSASETVLYCVPQNVRKSV